MPIKRLRKIHDGRIIVEDNNLSYHLEYIKENDEKKLQITDYYFKMDNLDFLRECPGVEEIYISSSYITDIEGLYDIKSLKKLSIHVPGITLDLTRFPDLVDLDIEWNSKIKGLSSRTRLKELMLYNYRPKNKNLIELEEMLDLTSLIITLSNITSFEGCTSLGNLKRLELNYCRTALNLDELSSLKLEEISIVNCKKFLNMDSLSKIKTLKKIMLEGCRKIPSIQFISEMPLLSYFAFVKTEVEDGNLTPLERLDYVAFDDKKHYSHSYSDFSDLNPCN
ncbi:hypothetical protein [Rossellomorea marisflavi]|uniref:hypothetical protein n=1 Tax=Rossellomorea marisflavi TaxID=189381 RepID=UPI003F9EDC63